jgi:pseudouridine kinase
VQALERDTSNPVSAARAFGGVARNVPENLARLGVPSALATLVGEDDNGDAILGMAERIGIHTGLSERTKAARTAEYVAVLEPDGSLAFGLADMSVFDLIGSAFLDRIWPALLEAEWVFADCNLPADVLQELLQRRRGAAFNLAVDAVSRAKVVRLPDDLNGIDLLFLNEAEAEALSGERPPAEAARKLRQAGAAGVIVTRGAGGALVCDRHGEFAVPARRVALLNVTGAGDAFMAGTLAAIRNGVGLREAVAFGTAVAALTVQSEGSVRPDLSPELLERGMALSATDAT